MKRRSMGLGVLAALAMTASVALSACSGGDRPAEERGTLSVPLSTQGPSGTTYRLRDATFEIHNEYYYYSGAGGNGNLNLQIQVYENPSDLYGYAGEPNVGGASNVGGAPPGSAGSP